ncbi:uncharacterized protein LOC115449019 [Manduca sexta]|uniref:uncharacterized protein LOC115449019 n=1 Tax=Manduca sexta TaxID=7130 RepID=UPI00188F8C3B|nr:uncharacterized protein LOC115449019 [Manduca sexta]XP_037298536.1 uncharacterized protein LOC115449019 [Manduca sexta]XP_037298537.1 uncharacterized protein LOC115449019 [Manduca sexta]XP_037298538.1 uncharacterized protein LOC115449019 [Manduca sexta]XP_037298539.1 uncharacterized protein LOC115449019 [Manduca sexta]
MSQPRMRKASVMVAGNGNRPHVAINKASGDSGPYAPAPKQLPEKRNRNKIPKTIRYDLENALVGLCDVWFEEIKPHLVRNNIKLHVHGAGVAGAAGPAGGDHQRLPPGAPGCSHLDPAFSAAGCELCRLLFNAANSIESAVSQAASAANSLPVTPVVAVTAVPIVPSADKPEPEY